MRKLLMGFLLILLFLPAYNPAHTADLEFDSFAEAEQAAQRRAQEYQQKMDEHMQNIQEDWDAQQKDLGSDNSNPDITKITSRSDGQRSSDNDAADSMENAVNSSVNNLKNTMINNAGPNSTGFAGGGAGYQWSVKYVGGKYVLSDSYNEAEFNTGKKKDEPAEPQPAAEGNDEDAKAVAKNTEEPAAPAEPTAPPQEEPPVVAKVPDAKPAATPGTSPGSSPGSSSSSSASSPGTPGSSSSSSSSPDPKNSGSSSSSAPASPASPSKGSSSPAKPASPGFDPAPAKLPPPKVRLVVQHPTDFSEEVFASNTDNKSANSYGLEKFRIPEDTRVKIAIEVSQDIDPNDVTLVMVDEEGERDPVSAERMGNYRHMFRVPSEGAYSANVYVADKDNPGRQKKLMQVKIPVTKVEFDSRTIDNQRATKSSDGSSSSTMSSSTSSSGSVGGYSHSTYGQSQQVDLSDLYSDPSDSSSDEAGTAGDGAAGAANTGSSDSYASGGAGSGGAGSSAEGYAGGSNPGSGNGSDSENAGANSGTYSSSGSETGSSGERHSATDDASGYNQNQYTGNSDEAGSYASGNGSNTDSAGSSQGYSGASEGDYSSAGGASDGSDSGYGNSSGYANVDDDGNSYGAAGQTGENGQTGSYNDNSSDNSGYYGEYASAQGVSSNSSSYSSSGDRATDSPDAIQGKTNEEEVAPEEEQDNFLASIGLRSEAHKIYQSFDFSEETTQTSTTLPTNSEIIFNIVLGNQVDRDSVQIKMADGGEQFSGNLKNMGEAFAYSFKNPSADSSFIQVSGRSGNQSFSYTVKIPVIKK